MTQHKKHRSFFRSITIPLFSFFTGKERPPKRLPRKIMKKIEARYMKAYVDYTDTSDGPSSLGTVSDYNRMLMEVFSDIEDEYPEIEDHYDEINKRLEELTMELARGRK